MEVGQGEAILSAKEDPQSSQADSWATKILGSGCEATEVLVGFIAVTSGTFRVLSHLTWKEGILTSASPSGQRLGDETRYGIQ